VRLWNPDGRLTRSWSGRSTAPQFEGGQGYVTGVLVNFVNGSLRRAMDEREDESVDGLQPDGNLMNTSGDTFDLENSVVITGRRTHFDYY
jgi:hypothetical protein